MKTYLRLLIPISLVCLVFWILNQRKAEPIPYPEQLSSGNHGRSSMTEPSDSGFETSSASVLTGEEGTKLESMNPNEEVKPVLSVEEKILVHLGGSSYDFPGWYFHLKGLAMVRL